MGRKMKTAMRPKGLGTTQFSMSQGLGSITVKPKVIFWNYLPDLCFSLSSFAGVSFTLGPLEAPGGAVPQASLHAFYKKLGTANDFGILVLNVSQLASQIGERNSTYCWKVEHFWVDTTTQYHEKCPSRSN